MQYPSQCTFTTRIPASFVVVIGIQPVAISHSYDHLHAGRMSKRVDEQLNKSLEFF